MATCVATPVGSDSSVLAGRRIVITRAPEQAAEFQHLLEVAGAETIFLPMVRFLDVEDTADISRAVSSMPAFDWLIFTSANAVRFFVKHWRARGAWSSIQRTPRIAAVGDTTRSAAEHEGLSVACAPEEFSGAALARVLGSDVAGKKVLLPRSDRAGYELPAALRAAGAIVTEVVAYRTMEAESLDLEIVAELRQGKADAITFFSPSAVRNFAKQMSDDGLRQVGSQTAFAAVGPATARAIREIGVPNVVEAAEASAASMVARLERYFAVQSMAKGRV